MKLLIVSAILIIVLTFISCSSNPVTNNNITTDSIKLIASYNLNVSEPSGLAYKINEGILYTVSDNAPYVYKISTTGIILDSINVNGSDMEGVCFASDFNSIYIIEERFRRVNNFSLNGQFLDSFHVNVTGPANNGLEGITINSITDNIYVANQKNPILLIELIHSGTEIKRTPINYVSEISDIFFDSTLNCLWMVSSGSKSLNKITTDGALIKSWSIPVETAEGIIKFGDKIYIVSDSEHKLYIFQIN
jgi:uncharacterized protein YjiK